MQSTLYTTSLLKLPINHKREELERYPVLPQANGDILRKPSSITSMKIYAGFGEQGGQLLLAQRRASIMRSLGFLRLNFVLIVYQDAVIFRVDALTGADAGAWRRKHGQRELHGITGVK